MLPAAGGLSIRRLRDRIRAELIARDPAAAERRRRDAEAGADFTVRPAPDGMATLLAALPRARAQAIWDAVNQLARQAKKAGDPRPLGVLRVAILEELVTRPWDAENEPVTANLTIHAPLFSTYGDEPTPGDGEGGDEPAAGVRPAARPGAPAERVRWLGGAAADPVHSVATVNGQPITAGQLRELLHRLDALGLRAPAAGSLLLALHDPATGRLRGVITRAELQRLVRRGCPSHPDGAGCDCPVLDAPPPVDRYRPSDAQRRFVTTRDRTCRHPGCHNRAGWADLDHVLAHAAGGDTDCANLCCLCRRHHRLKTHSPGWTSTMGEDGVLTVTTPSGVTRISRPPGLIDPACDPPPF